MIPDMADTPESHTPSSRKKDFTKSRKKRMEAIQQIILLDGVTAINSITEKLKERGFKNAERHGVSEDMQYMMYDDEFWLQAMTKSVWVAECRKQYLETNEEIDNLRKLSKWLQHKEMDYKEEGFDWEANPFKSSTHPNEYIKFEDVRVKAYAAFMRRYSHGLEIAQIENAITKKREWMHQFIKDLPLYWKLKQLANWVDLNKPKDQSIIAPIPEMEVLSAANQ